MFVYLFNKQKRDCLQTRWYFFCLALRLKHKPTWLWISKWDKLDFHHRCVLFIHCLSMKLCVYFISFRHVVVVCVVGCILTKPSIRDFWDWIFTLWKLEDSSRGLTSGSRSCESRVDVMKLYIHGYPQTVSQSVTEPLDQFRSAIRSHNQVREKAALGATRSRVGVSDSSEPRLRTSRERKQGVRPWICNQTVA